MKGRIDMQRKRSIVGSRLLSLILFMVMLSVTLLIRNGIEASELGKELIVGTGWDAARPGDYQPLGMWEPACLIYETLVNLDETSQPVPCLAQSWKVSDDGKIYTFHLQDGVRFHDGTPFDAQAVKLNYERLGRINWQAVSRAVDRVEVMDPLIIRFTLKRPVPLFFIHLAGSGYGIVAPSVMSMGSEAAPQTKKEMNETTPMEQMRNKVPKAMMEAMKKGGMNMGRGATAAKIVKVVSPVGTGPFKWDAKRYRRAQSFSVVENPSYWQGRPAFDRITWKVIPDPAARTIALETGEIHLTGQSPNASLTEENIRILSSNAGIAITQSKNWGSRLVLINHTRPPFDNPDVRKAFQMAMDTRSIQMLFQNMATVCPGPFGPDTPLTHPGLLLPEYNPDAAKALLDKAGVKDRDGDGIREFDGKPLRVEFTVAKSQMLAVLVCEYLKKIGIDAAILPKESGSIFEILKQMDFDIAVHPNIPSFYLGLYHTFHSKGRWSARFDLPELDALLEQGEAASVSPLFTAMDQFKTLSHRAQKMIHDQHIILFGINESKVAANAKALGRFPFPPEEWVGSMQDIWMGL